MSNRVVVVPPGEGTRIGRVEFLARTADSPRFNVSIFEVIPGGDGAAFHAHDDEDDAFFVLSGELTIELADTLVAAGPETFVLVPPGVGHAFSNRGSESVRVLNIHAPAGFDLSLARRLASPERHAQMPINEMEQETLP